MSSLKKTLTAQANEAITIAAVYEALQARATSTIVDYRLYNYSIARLVVIHSLSSLLYHTTEFVAERKRELFASNWVGRRRAEIRPTEIFVKI